MESIECFTKAKDVDGSHKSTLSISNLHIQAVEALLATKQNKQV